MEVFNIILKELIELDSKITHNAIRLTLKLYKDTNIKTFPYIQKEACKGYSINDGTYAFSMYLLEEAYITICSSYQVKDLLLKKNKIIGNSKLLHTGDERVIGIA